MKKTLNIKNFLFSSTEILIFVRCDIHASRRNWKMNSTRPNKLRELLILPIICLLDSETRIAIINHLSIFFKFRKRVVPLIFCIFCETQNYENSNSLIFKREAFALNKNSELMGIHIHVLNSATGVFLESFLNPGLSAIATNFRIKSRALAMVRALEFGHVSASGSSSFIRNAPSNQISIENPPLTFKLLSQLAIGKYLRKRSPYKNAWHIEIAKKSNLAEKGNWTLLKLKPKILAADPFLCEIGGKLFCYFEGIVKNDRYGKIYSVEIPSNLQHFGNQILNPKLELDLGSHASYPYIFSHDKELYMITESNSLSETFIHIYNVQSSSWVPFSSVLLGRKLLDPILYHDGSLFYIVASERVKQDSLGSAVIRLFSSNRIHDGWVEDPSRFVWDDRMARNAGSISEGWIFQDFYAGIYGKGVWIKKKREIDSVFQNKIEKLDNFVIEGFRSHHVTEHRGFIMRDISRI
jgi:hypothetical protein